jgi:FixJ family two-component response regulator
VQWNPLLQISINWFAEGTLDLMRAPPIAIIDDDLLVRDGLRRLVTSLDYTAETFSSTDEFLASDLPPVVGCVISDVQIPGDDAMHLRNRLIAIGCKAPIVFITARLSRHLETELVRTGAICVLAKPFSQRQLIHYVASALALHKAEARDDGAANQDAAAA